MENQNKVKRIKEMEQILEESTEIFANVNKSLDELEKNMKKYNKLDKYYSSENWFIDEESYREGKLPEDLQCGVLSEDLAYNLFIENNNIAIRMLEIATKMLKRE